MTHAIDLLQLLALLWAVSAAIAIEILVEDMPWVPVPQKLLMALTPVSNTLFVWNRVRNEFSKRR